jgi:hypothetical protein
MLFWDHRRRRTIEHPLVSVFSTVAVTLAFSSLVEKAIKVCQVTFYLTGLDSCSGKVLRPRGVPWILGGEEKVQFFLEQVAGC